MAHAALEHTSLRSQAHNYHAYTLVPCRVKAFHLSHDFVFFLINISTLSVSLCLHLSVSVFLPLLVSVSLSLLISVSVSLPLLVSLSTPVPQGVSHLHCFYSLHPWVVCDMARRCLAGHPKDGNVRGHRLRPSELQRREWSLTRGRAGLRAEP